MSATNELRRLLDTLGVEYYPKAADETVFSTGTEHVHVQDDLIDGCLELFIRPVTPQQAVEATLGRGTCRMGIERTFERIDGNEEYLFECSECGNRRWWLAHMMPRYCPDCGRKVVDA